MLSFARRDTTTFVIFISIVAMSFIGINYFKDYLATIGYAVLWIGLALFVITAWVMAGHAVMKSLFLVGASLSLIIFLAQSYCEIPVIARTGNGALKTLLVFGIVYIGFDFLRSLYKEITQRSSNLKKANSGERPWVFLIPFALFTGLFVWQIAQVLIPILQNLCIYK